MRPEWKTILGTRLAELRQRAHGGKGYSQKKAALTIGITESYLNRLETKLAGENPKLSILEQLCDLYGVTVADLFQPLVREVQTKAEKKHADLKEKLDFILESGVHSTTIGITENIHAMYERTRQLKKDS